MRKTIYTPQHEVFLQALRFARNRAGLTQTALAARLGVRQSWVSDVETGQRRLDLLELRQLCQAVGMSLAQFVDELEASLCAPVSRRE